MKIKLSDRNKFKNWIKDCPIHIDEIQDNFCNGYIEVRLICVDENDDEDLSNE